MKLIHERMRDLRDLYINQARVMLSAEQQIVRALPGMIEKATDRQLREAFESHKQVTEIHAMRLEGILNHTIGGASPEKCRVLAALVNEAVGMIEDSADVTVRDAALIAAAQRVEHYEIAAYGALRHFAEVLGLEGDAEIFNQTIQEEVYVDRLLTEIADRIVPSAEKAA